MSRQTIERQTRRRAHRLSLKPGPIRITAEGHQDLSHLDDHTVRPIRGRPGWVEPAPKPEGKGNLEVWGEAIIKNGDTEIRARNKLTGNAIRHLSNQGIFQVTAGDTTFAGAVWQLFHTNNQGLSYIRVGTGVGATIETTTALLAQIATNPSSTLWVADSPAVGTYRARFTATWNSGILPASTVTEIGIHGYMMNTWGSPLNFSTSASIQNATALSLFARLSTTDGEFTAFLINTTVPLTIEYRVIFTWT